MQASQALDSPLKWLRAQAASERLSRELGAISERYSVALQPTANALGGALGLSPDSTGIFAEEVVRGSSAAPLAQLAAALAPKLRQLAGLSSWEVISPASGLGKWAHILSDAAACSTAACAASMLCTTPTSDSWYGTEMWYLWRHSLNPKEAVFER